MSHAAAPQPVTLTAGRIAQHVQGQLLGSSDLPIRGVEQVERAKPGDLTFIGNEKYAHLWANSQASAVLLQQGLTLSAKRENTAVITVKNADLAMAAVLELLAPVVPRPTPGIHPTALVDPTAQLAHDVAIGPFCIVGPRVQLAAGVVLHPRVTLMDEVQIGSGSELFSGVVIRERCIIGSRCILHANVVIGSDGFGYRPAQGPQGPYIAKIPHLGIVRIEDEVEVGAGTTIDRAKFSETFIGAGTKIDNLCMIAHNCRIGRMCIIAGMSGLAGSVTLGDGVTLGGGVALRDHITLGAGATIAGRASVMNDVPAGETWGGYPAREARIALREHVAMRKLPDLLKKLKA